jgi:hypothetical protein
MASMSSLWRVSPGQIRISALQLCIFITLLQLALHACIATYVLRVLFHPIFRPRRIAMCKSGSQRRGGATSPGSRATLTQTVNWGERSEKKTLRRVMKRC